MLKKFCNALFFRRSVIKKLSAHIFCYFVKKNDLNTLKILLSNVKDVDFGKKNQNTPLWYAVDKDFFEIAETLLIHGADPNFRNSWNSTLLHLATRRGNEKMVRLLLTYGALTEVKDGNGQTPLGIACRLDYSNIAITLLSFGADVNHKFFDLGGEFSPLGVACRHYKVDLNLIELMVKKFKADVHYEDGHNQTPLFYAASRDSKIVKLFLDFGASINHQNKTKLSALHVAAWHNKKDCADILLASGIDWDLRDNSGESALHVAVKRNSIDILKLILLNVIDINQHVDNNRNTPLHFINGNPNFKSYRNCKLKCNQVLDVLLSFGGDMEMKNCFGRTPSMLATYGSIFCKRECPEVTYYDKMFLLAHGNKADKDLMEYQKELNKLKDIVIGVCPKVSLGDLLMFKLERVMKYVENKNLFRLLEKYEGNFEKEFPHFGLILNYRVRKGTMRKKLVKIAVDRLEAISACRLPEECSEKIFSHFECLKLKEFTSHNWDILKE